MGQALPTAKAPREVDLRFERGPKLDEVAKDDVVGRSVTGNKERTERPGRAIDVTQRATLEHTVHASMCGTTLE
jgi:hypothetical protein